MGFFLSNRLYCTEFAQKSPKIFCLKALLCTWSTGLRGNSLLFNKLKHMVIYFCTANEWEHIVNNKLQETDNVSTAPLRSCIYVTLNDCATAYVLVSQNHRKRYLKMSYDKIWVLLDKKAQVCFSCASLIVWNDCQITGVVIPD